MSFDHLGLAPELLRAVAQQGYTEPTPVQTKAIPLVLAGRDLLAGAQTGHRQDGRLRAADAPAPPRVAAQPVPRVIRALILTPTRELALQVEESVRTYGVARTRSARRPSTAASASTRRSARCAPGPRSSSPRPGRLLDHLGQRTIDLSRVEILVLDEADRMLDMGFIRDIRKILAVLPPRARTCSSRRRSRTRSGGSPTGCSTTRRPSRSRPATRPPSSSPRSSTWSTASASASCSATSSRPAGSTRRSSSRGPSTAPTGSPSSSSATASLATAIHGNKSQPQRVRALADFKAGRFAVLVATEVAARGLDIEALPHVVNFELPMVARGLRPPHRPDRPGRRRRRRGLAGVRRRAQAPQRHRARARSRHPARDDPGLRARSAHPTRADPAGRSRRRAAIAVDVGRGCATPRRSAPSRRWSAPGGRPATGRRPAPGGSSGRGRRSTTRSRTAARQRVTPGGSRPGNRGAGFAGPRRPGQGIGNGAGPRPASGGQRSGPRTGGDAPARSDGRGGGYGQPRPSNPGTVMPGERLARHGGRPQA